MAKTVSVKINLKNVDDVKLFVNASMRQDYDVDLMSGRYVVDGKSIMGIFSLDLSNELTLTAHTADASAFIAEIDAFVVK
jgi:Phosphotransferase system, HPr-related proteins